MKSNDQITPDTDEQPTHVIHAFGDRVHFFQTGEQTGGRFTSAHVITPPGSGPPPHYHTDEEEWFYVLEGTVSFFINNEWQPPVGPGTRVHGPRHVPHAFRNTGSTDLHMMIMCAPSGFETFFSRCGTEFSKAGGPDMSRIVEIAGEHGIHFLPRE